MRPYHSHARNRRFRARTSARTAALPGSHRVGKYLRYAAIFLGIALVLAACGVFALWQASQHEDEWYIQAVAAAEPAQTKEAGDEFERQALDLRNEARRTGQWQAVFTDEQVNAWLANDLIEKFPDRLPSSVSDPRVKFETDMAKLACRVTTSKGASVVVVGIDFYLTEQSNELAVRLRDARAGLVPMPKKRILDMVKKAARQSDVPVRWSQNEGDPVGLVNIPEQFEQIEGRLVLESVEVREGEIFLSGRTVRDDGSGGTTDVQRVIVSQMTDTDTVHR